MIEPLDFDGWIFNGRSITPNGVFLCINVYAIILPLLAKFHNAAFGWFVFMDNLFYSNICANDSDLLEHSAMKVF